LHASERDTPRVQRARRSYRRQLQHVEGHRVKFVDESGVNLALTPLYGRAPCGQRAVGSIPQNYGPNITLLGALGVQGLQALMTVDGATDGAVFRVFVRQVLCPTLRRGDIVVMDNLGAHKVEGIREAIEGRGSQLVYLPPYSPDFSPIEQCWSKFKTGLRRVEARTRRALERAITQTLPSVTATDAQAWFRHCGYVVH